MTDARDEVAFEVQAVAPVFLVLADTFAPGWTATLDGVEVPIHPAYHAFRSVLIPTAGHHLVQFHYRPPGFRTGAGITLLCLGILAVGEIRHYRTVTLEALKATRQADR